MTTQIKFNLLSVVIALAYATAGFSQGTLAYVTGVDKPSGGFGNIASDSWLAQGFWTGTYSNGYMVTGIQFQMANATGNPNGLTVLLYSSSNNFPGSSLAALAGDSNPLTSGIYSYSGANVALAPNSLYFLVATSSQLLSSGAFGWQTIASLAQFEMDGLVPGFPAKSPDGTIWERRAANLFQFSVTAITIPEPSGSMLMLAATILAVRRRRKRGSGWAS
jgi:hypothetical protein